METEFVQVEQRLRWLESRLARLRELRGMPRDEVEASPALRDSLERSLQVAVQSCLDIAHRLSGRMGKRPTMDDIKTLMELGSAGVVTPALARRLSPLVPLRNLLISEIAEGDRDRLYSGLAQVEDLEQFARQVRQWLDRERADRP